MQNQNTNKIEVLKSHFMKYGVDVVKNHYVDFKGRATRPDFWYFQLYMFIVLYVVGFVFSLLRLPIISSLAALALMLPALGISARRLHDLGKSGYWLLISIVPGILVVALMGVSMSAAMVFNYIQLAANIYLLVLFCMKGEAKDNAWGKAAK